MIIDYCAYINDEEYEKIPELFYENSETYFMMLWAVDSDEMREEQIGLFNYAHMQIVTAEKKIVTYKPSCVEEDEWKHIVRWEEWKCTVDISTHRGSTEYVKDGKNVDVFEVIYWDDGTVNLCHVLRPDYLQNKTDTYE